MLYKSYATAALIAAAALSCGTAQAQPLFASVSPSAPQYALAEQNDTTEDAQADPRLQRQVVAYASNEAPGTVIIDTPHTVLYYVLGNGKAIRYGIGVGRQGFTWSGVKQVARKAEWPDWIPAAGNDRAPALFAALRGRRPGQSARRARHVSRRHRVPHPRHQRSDHHRQECVEWLHPSHQ